MQTKSVGQMIFADYKERWWRTERAQSVRKANKIEAHCAKSQEQLDAEVLKQSDDRKEKSSRAHIPNSEDFEQHPADT